MAGLLFGLVALCLSSCGPLTKEAKAAAFAGALAAVDSLLASQAPADPGKALARASRFARASSDWLSLLKRARKADLRGGTGFYALYADRARSAFPGSEPLAAAAAHAYLRNGRGNDAFVLFRRVLSPEARPSLWMEAFLASAPSAEAKAADYARFAELAGEPQAYFGAAALALSPGAGPAAEDRLAARSWLEKGLAAGATPPPGLLWDSGLYDVLAARSDTTSDPPELALMGDAAWISGDLSLAMRRWERSAALGPRLSWKPYVKLALAAGEGERADSYWSRLRSAFLSGPSSESRDAALAAYVAHISRQGREGEALTLLDGGGTRSSPGAGMLEIMGAMIRGRGQPEGRLAADLERIAAARPMDGRVRGAVLRALFQRGMYGELVPMLDEAARRGLSLEYDWYYKATVLAARGDLPAAASVLAEAGEGAGTAGDFALGSLYGALGDSAASTAAFARAADVATGPAERCAAYKALGLALAAKGDGAGAARAFRSASLADPRDADAAILARGSAKKQGKMEDKP